MELCWNTQLSWAAGDTRTQRLEIGPTHHPPLGPGVCGTLRVGFRGPDYPAVRVSALVALADQGTEIGPIDLPFLLPCELPARLAITPEAPLPEGLGVCLSASPGILFDLRYGATRSVTANAGVVTPLPPWALAVSSRTPGAILTWLDATGAELGRTAPGLSPRPRSAHSVRTLVPALLVFHFTI